MPSTSSSSWAVWLIIILMLIVCIGIIIWFAIDNTTPGRPKTQMYSDKTMNENLSYFIY
jgi:hypothetical protein